MPSAARHPFDKGREEADLLLSSQLPGWLIVTLNANGIRFLSELSLMTDLEMLMLRGVGKRSVELIRTELARLERLRSPTLH